MLLLLCSRSQINKALSVALLKDRSLKCEQGYLTIVRSCWLHLKLSVSYPSLIILFSLKPFRTTAKVTIQSRCLPLGMIDCFLGSKKPIGLILLQRHQFVLLLMSATKHNYKLGGSFLVLLFIEWVEVGDRAEQMKVSAHVLALTLGYCRHVLCSTYTLLARCLAIYPTYLWLV